MLYCSKLGSPILEDNVVLSAGAKLVGTVRVGNNCIICDGYTINRDLEDSILVVSSSSKFKNKFGINRTYTTIN